MMMLWQIHNHIEGGHLTCKPLKSRMIASKKRPLEIWPQKKEEMVFIAPATPASTAVQVVSVWVIYCFARGK